MAGLAKVLVLDSTISNADEITIETAALKGVAEVVSLHVGNETELPEWIDELDAIIVWHQVKLTAATIGRLKKCKLIVRNGVGFDNVDGKAAGEAGIAFCNVTDYGTEEVADHALALALSLSRHLYPFFNQTRSGGWDWKIGETILRRFRGRVFGIIGLGRIGTAAALRAKAFNYDVVFYDPYLSPGVEKSLGIRRVGNLNDLLRQADLISLHCPLSDETRGMLGPDEFDRMKDGVFIVNTARGGIINLTALKAALRAGKVAGAGLDVIDTEPPTDQEVLQFPNVLSTPHAAFYSQESFAECRDTSAVIVRNFLTEGKLVNLVNSQYYKR